MSGTLARPAAGFSLTEAAIGGANARRLAAAAFAVIAVHVGLLLLRPGAAAGLYVAVSAPPVMAVRMLHAQPLGSASLLVAQAAEAPPSPALDRAPSEHVPSATAVTLTTPMLALAGTASAAQNPQPAAIPAANDTKGGDAPLAAAPDYAFGVRLDPGPRPLDDIEPDYPDTVRLREGIVVLRLLISDTGHVDNVDVVRAEPRGVFEQAAIEAFAQARFSPGLAAGTPVKSQILVEVQFMPINRGARVSGRTY